MAFKKQKPSSYRDGNNFNRSMSTKKGKAARKRQNATDVGYRARKGRI